MHFATPLEGTGDVGDLNAKDSSKETVLALLGMLVRRSFFELPESSLMCFSDRNYNRAISHDSLVDIYSPVHHGVSSSPH